MGNVLYIFIEVNFYFSRVMCWNRRFLYTGVLGEGTLVSWFGVFLVMVTRMDVLMCFRADILLEIPRLHISKYV